MKEFDNIELAWAQSTYCGVVSSVDIVDFATKGIPCKFNISYISDVYSIHYSRLNDLKY